MICRGLGADNGGLLTKGLGSPWQKIRVKILSVVGTITKYLRVTSEW